MNPLPIEYLHIESVVMLLFVALTLIVQFRRAAAPGYYVQGGRLKLRWLAVAFLAMSAVFSASLVRSSPLTGVALAGGITLSLMHPVNALCFMIHLMILRPWEIAVGNPVLMLLPRLMVVLCVFSWLLHPKEHARLTREVAGPVLVLCGFAFWLLITTVKASAPALAQAEWFDKFFKALTIFFMVLFLVEDDLSIQEVELTLVVSSLSLIAVGLYQYFSDALSRGRLQSGGMLGDPNDMAAIIVMALPFALAPLWVKEQSSPLSKGAGFIYMVMAASVIWLTRSRGAMLAVVAQFLVFRWVRGSGRRLGWLLLTPLILAGYFAFTKLIPRSVEDMATSEASRITLWKTAVNMGVRNPILGVGFNQYPSNYESYAVGTVHEWGQRTAHSSWFLVLGESGFVGFIFFTAFVASIVRKAWLNKEMRPEQLFSVVGYGVAMSFLSHAYSQYFYFLMALILASAGVSARTRHVIR
ncbi:MAG: O-antigen ligase family protein [Elusimicrobiota bacterium]